MENKRLSGHFAAIFTIIVWGTTFISTKVLLTVLNPVVIMFVRLLIGWMALFIAHPQKMKGVTKKQELTFAIGGLSGITLYYFMENGEQVYKSNHWQKCSRYPHYYSGELNFYEN